MKTIFMQDRLCVEGGSFLHYLDCWRETVDLRVTEAVATISAIPQVTGIILGGSVGRGETWPLSDIDLIYVAADAHDPELPERVDEIGLGLRDERADAGWSTSIDVGKLFLTHEEACDLIAGRSSVEELMGRERVFHALDKCYGGRPAFVSKSCDTERLAELLTEKRFTEPVVLARQRERLRCASVALQEARLHLELNDPVAAAASVEQLARPLIPFLLEHWREGDRSFGRVFTRFLREAVRRGAGGMASQILGLYALDDSDVGRRFASAPPHVVERHDRSYTARKFIGEAVREIDDQRDVLYAFSWYAIRRGELDPHWVGLGTDASAVTRRMDTAVSIWNTALANADAGLSEEFAFV